MNVPRHWQQLSRICCICKKCEEYFFLKRELTFSTWRNQGDTGLHQVKNFRLIAITRGVQSYEYKNLNFPFYRHYTNIGFSSILETQIADFRHNNIEKSCIKQKLINWNWFWSMSKFDLYVKGQNIYRLSKCSARKQWRLPVT